MAVRRLSDRPLHVESVLVGQELASPTRRMLAFLIDSLLLIVPTVAVSVAVAMVALQQTDPRAFNAVRIMWSEGTAAATKAGVMRDLVAVLVRIDAAGLPAAAKTAVEEGRLDEAVRAIDGYNISFNLSLNPEGGEAPVINGKGIMLPVHRLIPSPLRAIVIFAVPGLYFTLLTWSRLRGTIGKRLLGMRVVRLDGEPLSILESLERFVGYLHIPLTMFVSVADLWRDPNRRMPHDRTVHTAVVRVHRAEARRFTAVVRQR